MREFATAPLSSTDGYRNATDLLVRRLRDAPGHVAFEVADTAAGSSGPWRTVTTAQFAEQVRALAKGLIAAGVEAGDAVALLSATRYEWAVADLACWFAGAVVVPVYETSAPVQVTAVLADARVCAAIGGSRGDAALLEFAFEQAQMTPLGVWSMDQASAADLTALARLGDAIEDATLEQRRCHADLDAVATIVYTSGTTAKPKGALITHRNLVGQVLTIAAAYTQVVRSDGNTVIFLPLAHVLARGLQLACLAGGMRIAHLSDPGEVVPVLARLRPTFLVVVPRVLQKVRAAAAQAASAHRLGRLWAAAERAAIAWGRVEEERLAGGLSAPGAGLRLRHVFFDLLFYRRLRARLGGRLGYLLCGAAALEADLSLFFCGIGVPVIEGYGLTETTAPLTGNLPGDRRSGTVGRPLPGTTVRISAEGEVLARGTGVFAGYRDPVDNADAFVDGFFRTGDLGALDDDGRLHLAGRLKDVIVTAAGKTVNPGLWEASVEADPLVAHAVVVGEGRPYLGGLILLDPDSVEAWSAREGVAVPLRPVGGALEVADGRLREAIARIVEAANAQLARSEQVRRFALVLADLSAGDGVVTPTQKLKRSVFAEWACDIIDSLYAEAGSAA